MTSKKAILEYLEKAQSYVDSAIKATEAGNNERSQGYILRAIFQLRAANKLLIQEHITKCIPQILREISIHKGIEEIIKTHRYIPS